MGKHPSSKVRRDAIRVALQNHNWRLALTIAVMPAGWVLYKDDR